jgi:hypothetical protein
MANLVRYLPSAAFYVFALAAQVSGFTSPTVALLLATVGTIFLTLPACHRAKIWHDSRKDRGMVGLDSWYFIAPCLVVAALAIAGAAYGFGLRSVKPVIRESASQKSSYLKEAYIYGPSPSSDPRFSAKFARSGTRGRLFVDDSYYVGNFGSSFWTDRKRIPIAQPITDFVAEQSVNIPILTSVSGLSDDGTTAPKMWRWGDGKTDTQTVYSAHSQHRGRIVFISDDAPPEYFYFIILIAPVQEAPTVIGHFNFDFIPEWESKDGKQD